MDPVTHKFNPPNHSRSLNKLLFHFSRSFTHFYRLSHSELVDIEKVAVCSSLRSLKPKCTIESRAKRSSKNNLIRTLFHYACFFIHSENEDGNPARANFKQALGRKVWVWGPNVITSQDGNAPQQGWSRDVLWMMISMKAQRSHKLKEPKSKSLLKVQRPTVNKRRKHRRLAHTSDLPLSTSLNDLDNATLHIDGQPTEVDVLPDIIDVVDEDDDITDDEDALPHDLVDSDNEDLINVDDDDVSRSYDDDGGGEDCPLHTMYLAVAWVSLLTEHLFDFTGKGKRKLNLGGKAAGRLNTRDKTRNLSLKEITDTKGRVPIQFELHDKQTVMPFGDHAVHWSSYIGEVIRGVPLYYPSWMKVPKERKTALITDIGFNLRPHMESPDWTEINAGIQQYLQKAYNTNKAAFKAQH
nr:hypothetical protein [Tanacetum cinerariifolium]